MRSARDEKWRPIQISLCLGAEVPLADGAGVGLADDDLVRFGADPLLLDLEVLRVKQTPAMSI